MPEFDRIWFQADHNVARALCEVEVVDDNLYWFCALDRFRLPDAGIFVVKLPDEDVNPRESMVEIGDPIVIGGVGNRERSWAQAETWAKLVGADTASCSEVAPSLAERYRWLPYVTPPANLLEALKSLARAHACTIAFSHQMERGDDLYYEAYWVFDCRKPQRPQFAERLYVNQTFLVAEESQHLQSVEGGVVEVAEASRGREFPFARLMRHLGARTELGHFPPNDWINRAQLWDPYKVSWNELTALSREQGVSIAALLRGLSTTSSR